MNELVIHEQRGQTNCYTGYDRTIGEVRGQVLVAPGVENDWLQRDSKVQCKQVLETNGSAPWTRTGERFAFMPSNTVMHQHD